MEHFPNFIKNDKNKICISQQNSSDIEGYYYTGKDNSQLTFWECLSERTSIKHTHDFDEYMMCVSGEYTAYLNDKEPGDKISLSVHRGGDYFTVEVILGEWPEEL